MKYHVYQSFHRNAGTRWKIWIRLSGSSLIKLCTVCYTSAYLILRSLINLGGAYKIIRSYCGVCKENRTKNKFEDNLLNEKRSVIPMTDNFAMKVHNFLIQPNHFSSKQTPSLPQTCNHRIIHSTIEPHSGKTNNVVSDQVQHKPTCTVTEKS